MRTFTLAALAAVMTAGAAYAADPAAVTAAVHLCCDFVLACCGQGKDCCP